MGTDEFTRNVWAAHFFPRLTCEIQAAARFTGTLPLSAASKHVQINLLLVFVSTLIGSDRRHSPRTVIIFIVLTKVPTVWGECANIKCLQCATP